MNRVSTTYLQANIGEIVLMLIRGEEVILTRNGRELGTIVPKKMCKHCKMDIAVRNPSGYCDHLYYPENCDVCKMKAHS